MRRREQPKRHLGNKSFNYDRGFKYDYSVYYDCENGSDCCDNDYCRCGRIESTKILSVGPILHYFGNLEELDLYCVDRILAQNNVWDTASWKLRVTGGYYGEEIDGIYLTNSEEVENLVKECLALKDTTAKIEYVLNLEYGYLLEQIKNKKWEIKEVPKGMIRFGQHDHFVKLNKEAVAYYKTYTLPRGICLENEWEDGSFRVIDGYHRLSACQEDVVKIISAKA